MQIAREAARTARSGQPVGSNAPIGLGAIAGGTWRERVVMGLAILTTLAMLVTIWAVFAYAPVDAVQGVAFRIFYFHVPMAWVAYLAFFVVFIASIVYLWRKDERWDWLARASAELGTVFTTLVLITGSLWGRPIWGTWWTWDPRLTTTLILWFIYVGYLMLRSYTGRTAAGARMAAVLGIAGFVDVPIDYLSVTWWRTIHPPTSYVTQSTLPPAAVTTLMLSLATFTLLFSLLLVVVYQLQRLQTGTEQLRGRIER